MIGGVACVTSSSNDTHIVCRVGDGETGTFPVMVNVEGLGNAENTNNSVTFTYQFSIQSMAPSSVSLGGKDILMECGQSCFLNWKICILANNI